VNRDENRFALAAKTLREAFDESFAHASKTGTSRFEDYLAVRVGGDPHAIHLTEIASLFRDRKVVPIISEAPHLLGIASFRGVMAPVYDLAGLLGYSAAKTFRWLVMARVPAPIALALDLFEAHLRVPRDSQSPPADDDTGRKHIRGAIDTDIVRPIIHIASVLEAITGRVLSEGAPKEH